VSRVHFPTAKDKEPEYLEALRGADVIEAKTITIDRLEHEVRYGASHQPVPAQSVKNDPPKVLCSAKPVVLVLVDGAPQYRDDGGVRRVINTRALVFTHPNGATYTWAGDRWFSASSVDGTYTAAQSVPPEVEAAKKRLQGSSNVELFTEAIARVRDGASVIVATKPTELIETRGAPVYEPIQGTTVSWVRNTDADVLRDDTSQQTYVLLSGRWFRAASLEGPWTYVAGRDLPAAFRNVPQGHREARVLASIPGTPQSEESIIAASVPQTATVDRSQIQLGVDYDGSPDFQPVQGTSAPMSYAVNTDTPVIQTADGMYYAVENGVWFVSAAPDGPWTVATSVPDAMYSIPPSSPIHYVTYVRIYGYSPDYAYVGYTPGYVGALCTDGVVVWGTGYGYRPWVGNVWYGGPSTYGFGVGFGFRPPVVIAGRSHPWWGPTRYASPHWGWGGGYYGYGVARPPIYQHWSPSVVRAPPAYPTIAPRAYAPAVGGGYRGYPATPGVGRPYPATPGVGRGYPQAAPRAYAPAAPRAPRGYAPAAPGVGARVAPPAAAPGVAPRIYAPNRPPSFSAPSPSPRISAPASPRISAPPMAPPRISAPPMAGPRMSTPSAPRVSAPPAGRR